MNRKVQLSEETSSQNNTADKRNREKIIHVVYIIAALEITWMFLQFSITPVSIRAMSKPRFPCMQWTSFFLYVIQRK